MATIQSAPLVSSSTLRQIRAQRFGTKTPLGPETTRAVISADLNQEREAADADARLLSQERSADANRAESARQFDVQQANQERQREAAEPTFFDGIMGS